MFPAVISIILVAGLFLLVVGWRGRRVDEHPVCRRCRYDMVGLPGAAQCPECGAALTHANALRMGNRRRRRGMLAMGGVLAILGLTGIGGYSYVPMVDYDWRQHMPFGWTLSAARTAAGQPNEPNVAELERRFATRTLNNAQVRSLVEAALDVHGDDTIAWPNGWSDLLDQLLAAGRLSDADVKRYLEQAIDVELKVKPAIRRGRLVRLHLDNAIERVTGGNVFDVAREAEAVTLGGAELVRKGSFDGDAIATQKFSHSYTLSTGAGKELESLPIGPMTLETAMVYDITLVQPRAYPTVTIRVPISIPVQLADHDAWVDEFVVDESHRQAMAQVFTRARVETNEGEGSVWCWLEPSPVALSMGVWVVHGEDEWRIGGMRVDAEEAARWRQCKIDLSRTPSMPTAGVVTVELRPDQDPSDTHPEMGRYWGGTLRREGVVINAPYEPAFNMDASHAKAMEKAVYLDRIIFHRGDRPRIGASLNAFERPVRVAYRIRVRAGGDWVDAPEHLNLSAPAKSSASYGTGGLPLPDPDATHVDILFVPDREWERLSADGTPPWGYAILFERIPVSYDVVLGRPVYGRALVDEAVE